MITMSLASEHWLLIATKKHRICKYTLIGASPLEKMRENIDWRTNGKEGLVAEVEAEAALWMKDGGHSLEWQADRAIRDLGVSLLVCVLFSWPNFFTSFYGLTRRRVELAESQCLTGLQLQTELYIELDRTEGRFLIGPVQPAGLVRF